MRVPYRGLDEWTRIVIALGGTCWSWPPRCSRSGRAAAGMGFPLAALVLLVALYAVPTVALDFQREFLRGALLALLVLAFLRLEKLRSADSRRPPALAALARRCSALIVAPALDADQPWWDYETGRSRRAGSKSATFSWDHAYGPLNWPRDGRELLRVKAQERRPTGRREPRRVRRPPLAREPGRADRGAATSSSAGRAAAARWRQQIERHGAQPAHADVRHRGLRGRRSPPAQDVARCPIGVADVRARQPQRCAAATPTG